MHHAALQVGRRPGADQRCQDQKNRTPGKEKSRSAIEVGRFRADVGLGMGPAQDPERQRNCDVGVVHLVQGEGYRKDRGNEPETIAEFEVRGLPAHASGAFELARNSSTISRAAFRASSPFETSNEIAPTRAWPPPPYRSQILARLTRSSRFVQGFEPTETLFRKLLLLRPTL